MTKALDPAKSNNYYGVAGGPELKLRPYFRPNLVQCLHSSPFFTSKYLEE